MNNNEQSLGEVWDTIKHTSICIMVAPGRGEKEIEKNIQRIFENSKLDAKH